MREGEHRWWRRVGAVALAVVLAVTAAPGAPATAEPYEDGAAPWAGSRYSSTPRSGWNTTSSRDFVYDIAQIGNRIYVAGTFRAIRWGQGTPSNRSYLVALRRDTGEVDWSFRPRLNGPVYSLAVSDDGRRLYAGGAFSRVNGGIRRGLVALTPRGGVVRGFRADVRGAAVRSVVATRRFLYVGGSFRAVNGVRRQNLARLNRGNGRVSRAWNARATGGAVRVVELPPSRDRVYVGGAFDEINGRRHTERIAALRTDDGGVDFGFDAFSGRVVLDLLADGRGRVWTALDGQGGRAQLLADDGRELRAWDTDGDVQTIERVGDKVLLAGHEMRPGDREIAAVSYDDPRTWDTSHVNLNLRASVWALHADGRQLWVGGEIFGPFHGFGRYAAR